MDAPRPIRWESLTKKDFDAVDRSRAVVLVTCSPMEVHGPHLPLGADALEGQPNLEARRRERADSASPGVLVEDHRWILPKRRSRRAAGPGG